jgi:acetaldehyde dehydrogenase (acetylating)
MGWFDLFGWLGGTGRGSVPVRVVLPRANMVTCGGQATVPMVAAVAQVAPVAAAGPGTRANIDEFTETTAAALSAVGGALRGKAVIILNAADPPIMMRNTVYCLIEGECITRQSRRRSKRWPRWCRRTCRLSAQAEGPVRDLRARGRRAHPGDGQVLGRPRHRAARTGAAHHLPAYPGNLDIMTSAALTTAERIALHGQAAVTA